MPSSSRACVADPLAALAADVVGHRPVVEAAFAALSAGRDLMLVGPPGTGKSTLLRAIARASGAPLILVEGNADLTALRLVGHHDPARALREDYSADNFISGPLVRAMETGAILYIEELNRVPEDTLNSLLRALAEREISIPRAFVARAKPTFRLVGTQNPYDGVGTSHVSASLRDRLCQLRVGYQTADEETDIVTRRTGVSGDLAEVSVRLVRRTRRHPDLWMGASVRGAIDLALIATQLERLCESEAFDDRVLRAARLALSGRIHRVAGCRRAPEDIIREIWEDELLEAHRAPRGELRFEGENAVQIATNETPANLPALRRPPKTLDALPRLYAQGDGGLIVLTTSDDDPDAADADPDAGREVVAFTDERGRRALRENDATASPDPALFAMYRRIARRLHVRAKRRDRRAGRGAGGVRTMPYRFNSDDIDLDRTLEVLTERPIPEPTDIFVRERSGARRAIALIVDLSGSMDGEKIRVAAATVAALTAGLVDDELAVIGFWKDAVVIKRLNERRSGERILRDLCRIPTKGLTNIHFALETALAMLASAEAERRVAILLSDVVHNAGPDPRNLARRFDRLHVLLETIGTHDRELAEQLARLGHGTAALVGSYRDVPAAVNEMLS